MPSKPKSAYTPEEYERFREKQNQKYRSKAAAKLQQQAEEKLASETRKVKAQKQEWDERLLMAINNNEDLKEADVKSYGQDALDQMPLPETFLFGMSISRIGRALLKQAGCHELPTKLPDGFDWMLIPSGQENAACDLKIVGSVFGRDCIVKVDVWEWYAKNFSAEYLIERREAYRRVELERQKEFYNRPTQTQIMSDDVADLKREKFEHRSKLADIERAKNKAAFDQHLQNTRKQFKRWIENIVLPAEPETAKVSPAAMPGAPAPVSLDSRLSEI